MLLKIYTAQVSAPPPTPTRIIRAQTSRVPRARNLVLEIIIVILIMTNILLALPVGQ